MKILVTGGTGFLGQKLAYRLVELGHEVTAIGRNDSIGELLNIKDIRYVKVDLVNRSEILKVCSNQEFVFHCGALSSPWGKYRDFYNTNVIGTKNVIDGSRFAGCKRLIHISSPSIYFDGNDRFNIKEQDSLPKKFINYYAHTKFLAEKEIDAAFVSGVPVITIRPRGIFGPGDQSIFPRLIRANEKGFVPVIKNTRVLIDITYIENVVDAMLLCMNSRESTLGQKYNISNGEPIVLHEFLETLMQKLGIKYRPLHLSFRSAYSIAAVMEAFSRLIPGNREPLITRYTVEVLSKCQTLDICAARKDLGYVPRVSINQGLDKFLSWWIEGNK